MLGHKLYASLEEYGKPIDLSVIAVPTAAVKGAVISSLKAGAKAVVVITAGFKEVGEEGARHGAGDRRALPRFRRPADGPQLPRAHQHPSQDECLLRQPHAGNEAAYRCSRSRALSARPSSTGRPRARWAWPRCISIGNKADLDETDFLAAFADDEETKVIVGYLESIGSGDEFIRVAESVAAVKPVVILKAGTTSAGSKAASSHTGALAGADIAYGAAFKRAGIIRADTFESLFDFATALAMQPLPKGDRVAIITNAGGPGIMAADAVETAGMKVASLHPDVAEELREKLPAAASVGNPIDVLGDADPERYAMAVEAAQDDPSVDAVIVILTPQAMTKPAGDRARHRRPGQRGEAGARQLHGRRGHHARPRRAGGCQPARLSLARARRGRPQGHAWSTPPGASARRASSPASRSTGAAWSASSPGSCAPGVSTSARPRPRTSCAPTTSSCPTAAW